MNIFATEYNEYLAYKKSGQRKAAMKALNIFLGGCEKMDDAGKRKVITDFFQKQDAGAGVSVYSFPLNSQLLFPVLQEWCGEKPNHSWIWRSFAEIASFREYLTEEQCSTLAIDENTSLDDLPVRQALCKALELAPADNLARIMYIEVLLETLKLLIHDHEAGDGSALPLIPGEARKVAEQLALLPDGLEKVRLQKQYRIYTDKFTG